jgi:hypothetical protein
MGQKSPSAGAANHVGSLENSDVKPVKTDIVALMSAVAGTTEVDLRDHDSRFWLYQKKGTQYLIGPISRQIQIPSAPFG